MIEIVLLFLGVYGVYAAPEMMYRSQDYENLDYKAEVAPGLPGINNLNEKAIPLSRLFEFESAGAQESQNLEVNSHGLPGANNLQEKRIPDYVLQKLSQSSDADR
ncbi:hypothetical protein KM043_011503 [Ampulex compressa]|nr:hypothetical protein KM043_011503 [Ampulex compressa]